MRTTHPIFIQNPPIYQIVYRLIIKFSQRLATIVQNYSIIRLLGQTLFLLSFVLQDAIDRIKTLQEEGQLTGVIDDRGKFIYITKDEYEAVAKFIKQRGRVSISELAESMNRLINLNPDNTLRQDCMPVDVTVNLQNVVMSVSSFIIADSYTGRQMIRFVSSTQPPDTSTDAASLTLSTKQVEILWNHNYLVSGSKQFHLIFFLNSARKKQKFSF